MFRRMLCVFLVSTICQAGTTVTYIYTDPQGTPLAEADTNGNVISKFDYAPYGMQVMGNAPAGPGYTGHVNDSDVSLIYMQARYYDSSIGRFLSPDPLLPQPGNVGNFNIYSYVSNNPVNFTDPTGMYVCSGSKENCDAFRDRIRMVDRASRRLPPGPGRNKLRDVVKAYGPENGQGQVNGSNVNVTVDFGNLGAGIFGQTTVNDDGSVAVTFNESEMATRFSRFNLAVETAATAAHEGDHIIGLLGGNVYHNFYSTLRSETMAYMTQSYVNEAFDAPSAFGVWHPRWRSSDPEHYRKAGALEAGTEQAFLLCPQRKCK